MLVSFYPLLHTPNIAESSAKVSHGTHVALTGSIQNKNLRVFPIRVTTDSMYTNSDQIKEMKFLFKSDFQDWLRNPLVIKALREEFGDIIDFSSKDRGVNQLMDVLSKTMDVSFDSKSFAKYIFFKEIVDAIKEVGRQKIKLANVSLGINFSKSVPSQFEVSAEKKISESYKFLLHEYFKFRIGEVISKHAKNTLFIVAVGNEGNWVDGRSRSALPGNISSLWLRNHETTKTVAPNNRVNNILAVGSLDKEGKVLSSFTNIPIEIRNLIFARGETVLAAGGKYDSTIVKDMIDHILPKAKARFSSVYLNSDLIKRYLIEKKLLTAEEASNFTKSYQFERSL